MITSETAFKVTQEQRQRLEEALAVLRRTATPAECAAQGPAIVEHIRHMRAEIAPYLGMADVEVVSLQP